MQQPTVTMWKGDVSRALAFYGPCPCGCDSRDGDKRSYLSASDAEGNGFTVRITKAQLTNMLKGI